MKVLFVPVPTDYHSSYEAEMLSEYYLTEIANNTGADLFAYWYTSEPYSGSGSAILRTKGKYHLFSLSHCSCYGPTNDITSGAVETGGYDTLDALLAACSNEYREKEIRCLAEAIIKEETPVQVEAAGAQRRVISLED